MKTLRSVSAAVGVEFDDHVSTGLAASFREMWTTSQAEQPPVAHTGTEFHRAWTYSYFGRRGRRAERRIQWARSGLT